MPHSDFEKCIMLQTIKSRTKLTEIKDIVFNEIND